MKYQRRRRLVRWFFLAGMVACLIPIGQSYLVSGQHKAQQDALKRMVDMSQETAGTDMDNANMQGEALAADSDIGGQQTDETGRSENSGGQQTDETGQSGNIGGGQTDGNSGPQEASEPAMLRKYAALYQENEDLVGWLSIEGTGIDYPVLQCEDDEYYLHHDFYGEDSKYGCLYVREQADLDGGTNFIIYGHNMRDGAMFGDLDLYLKESFFREHPTISFDTLYEERVYEIVAVFRSQVYHADDEVFKYYQFYEADTREEFEDFYRNIKALSIYDTGVEAEFGDTFLTCSTCAYHVEDGRFVVVAKRRQE